MDGQETPLRRGGRTTAAIVRIEDSVRHPAGPRSAFVHHLLISLKTRGFSGAPRFLEIDSSGREILFVFTQRVPAQVGSFFHAPLGTVARLLRQFHEASASCELTDGVDQNFNELTSAPNVQVN